MKIRILALAVIALFLAAFAASAQTGTWTAVGSTGTVDPTQVAQFGVFSGTRLGFNPAAGSNAGTLTVRFNVTNTYGGGVADIDPVAATLYKVNPCTGARTAICTVTNTTGSISGACATCPFAAGTINFGTNLYYVEVTITRSTGTGNPQLSTLRIF